MKITAARAWTESMELTRPYTIAFTTITAVKNIILQVECENGLTGLGCAAPFELVTGESFEECAAALSEQRLAWLLGKDIRELHSLCRENARSSARTPAARAAVDVALHDAFARHLGLPLVNVLGRCHDSLPTSITIGIMPVEETLADAEEYIGRGFTRLKVKTGQSVDEDVERIRKLREKVGLGIGIRVDANQGYTSADLLAFVRATADLDIELIEQPLPADAVDEMRALPETVRSVIAADESLKSEHDLLKLLTPEPACGIFNIKLMKCGGIYPAQRIASMADLAGVRLMWGCMDESVISITAALHAALASPATRYLDLDGSLDLGRDPADGGFVLRGGAMSVSDAPGLGVDLCQ